MNDNTPKPFTAMVEAGRHDVAVPNGQVYITHEQAVRLYGDPVNGSSLDPESVLGALMELKIKLMGITHRRAQNGDADDQLRLDTAHLLNLDHSLDMLIAHAKDGGLFFEKSQTGIKRLLGTKFVPLGDAAQPLNGAEQTLYTENGKEVDTSYYLRVDNVVPWVQELLKMTERYRSDLGEEQYNNLTSRLRNALNVPDISEGIAGLLPKTTTPPDGAAAFINTSPSRIQRG